MLHVDVSYIITSYCAPNSPQASSYISNPSGESSGRCGRVERSPSPFFYNAIAPIKNPAPSIAACVGFDIPVAAAELEIEAPELEGPVMA